MRVWGLRSRVEGLRSEGLGLGVEGVMSRVGGFGLFRVRGLGFSVWYLSVQLRYGEEMSASQRLGHIDLRLAISLQMCCQSRQNFKAQGGFSRHSLRLRKVMTA